MFALLMMDCVLRFSGIIALLWVVGGPVRASPEADARATVVVYNSSDPSSESLARYYAKRREIPEDHLVGLPCPVTEEISRAEFETTIAEPIRERFVREKWWSVGGGRVTATTVRFVALIRGMPLKIRSQGKGVVPRSGQPGPIGTRDEASVDSELACLGLGKVPAAGIIPNSYFRRFTGIVEAIADPGLLLVCRLDAPTEITVRGMIDDAISAERDGLWGWAYVDLRNIKSGGYAMGDEWLTEAVTNMRRHGIPVLADKAPETLPAGYPVTDAAVYLGWYANAVNGPFASPALRFRPGAVAVHIHSFSAATLRNPVVGWCGPLLERGAAVTLGNVYEPYLALTAHLDIFQDRLMQGFGFAESAYMSMQALSWMGVVIGDPLYRPYANWSNLAEAEKEPSSWERYRDIISQAEGKVLAAADPLRKAAQETGRSMFLESLAAVQADAGEYQEALASVDRALKLENSSLVQFRLKLEKFGLLSVTTDKSIAAKFLLSAGGKSPAPDQVQLLAALRLSMISPPSKPSSGQPVKK